MKTIGLCMIVKDEAHVIRRCLESVRPLIDYALIVDTGSTDATQLIVKDYFAATNLPGAIVAEPWRDFAYNRSFALAKLRERRDVDYALVIDADDTLNYAKDFDAVKFKEHLDKDFYVVELRLGGVRFWRTQILSNRAEFAYKGVLHEFVAGPRSASASAVAPGLWIKASVEGARSRNIDKYSDDAKLLEKALETETDEFIRARYLFYLGQSWMNAGEKEKALQAFSRRTELGAFRQEVSLSLYYAAQMKDALGFPETEVIGAYLKAYEADPARAEPLHGAMDYCRRHHKPNQAYLIGKYAIAMPQPKGSLFVESWIYEFSLLEEFSVAAYRSGHYKECLDAIDKLLADGLIPKEAIPRLRENARAAAEKLNAGTRPAQAVVATAATA